MCKYINISRFWQFHAIKLGLIDEKKGKEKWDREKRAKQKGKGEKEFTPRKAAQESKREIRCKEEKKKTVHQHVC